MLGHLCAKLRDVSVGARPLLGCCWQWCLSLVGWLLARIIQLLWVGTRGTNQHFMKQPLRRFQAACTPTCARHIVTRICLSLSQIVQLELEPNVQLQVQLLPRQPVLLLLLRGLRLLRVLIRLLRVLARLLLLASLLLLRRRSSWHRRCSASVTTDTATISTLATTADTTIRSTTSITTASASTVYTTAKLLLRLIALQLILCLRLIRLLMLRLRVLLRLLLPPLRLRLLLLLLLPLLLRLLAKRASSTLFENMNSACGTGTRKAQNTTAKVCGHSPPTKFVHLDHASFRHVKGLRNADYDTGKRSQY